MASPESRVVSNINDRLSARWVLATAAWFLAGCASLAPDAGFDAVERVTREQLGQGVTWARGDAERSALDERVTELLAQPLTPQSAVQVALLNNRELQAAFSELGIADAERVQAGRLANPGFTFARLERGDELEIERSLHVNLARLLVMPLATQVASRRVEQVQRETAMQVLALAADTRKAWVNAVAADEGVRYARQVMEAAEASAELARRMEQVGNFNKLQRAREQSFYADAALNLARATQRQGGARERLTRLMGLWGEQTAYRLPERLPDLPAAPRELPDAEQIAMAQRLDVNAARLGVEQMASNLDLTRTTRFVNVLELGLVHNSSNAAPPQRGFEVSVELPLFDWGDARIAKAEAIYMQALNRAAAIAVNARSEVREAYIGYRHAFDIAKHHRDEIVPLRKRIADENLLRYNGMLIGVFELLADARAQIASVGASIDALRDFWLAQADLDMALIGKPALALRAGAADMRTSGPAEAAGGH